MLDRIRIPTWIVIGVWLYTIWRVFKSGILQEAIKGAIDYVRPIKF